MDFPSPMNNPDLEKIVLATIVQWYELYKDVRDILNEDCFYIERHKDIYRSFLSVESSGATPNVSNVWDMIERENRNVTLPEYMDTIDKCKEHELIDASCMLKDISIRRNYQLLAQKLLVDSQNRVNPVDYIKNTFIEEMKTASVVRDKNTVTLREAVSKMYDVIKKNAAAGSSSLGLFTGFNEIDSRGGFFGGDLVLIAGDSGSGKTSFALNVATAASEHGAKVGIFSKEMRDSKIAARIVSSYSGVSSMRIIRSPELTQDEIGRIDNAVNFIRLDSIYIDDSYGGSVDSTLGRMRTMHEMEGVDMFVVDYLQLLNMGGRSRDSDATLIANTIRKFKNFALEYDVVCVVLSQFNRSYSSDSHRPNRNMLYGSTEIYNASDVVIYIYRPEVWKEKYKGYEDVETRDTAQIIIDKGRDTGIYEFFVKFDKTTTTFSDLESIPKADDHTDVDVRPNINGLPF